MQANLIPINSVIGDRSYRIKINPNDEAHVRKTVKTLNEQIIEYKTNFAGKDMQDYIAMVTIWYATQITTVTGSPIEQEQLLQQLQQVSTSIDAVLTK